MASLLEEYHKQAHEQSAQFGYEANCKTPVQLAQSNIVHTTTYAKVCSAGDTLPLRGDAMASLFKEYHKQAN